MPRRCSNDRPLHDAWSRFDLDVKAEGAEILVQKVPVWIYDSYANQ